MTGAASTSASTAAGVRAASAGTDTGLAAFSREGCHDATGGTAGGQIGYRWQAGPGCSVSKARATGPTSAAQHQPRLRAPFENRSRIDAFGLITGQVGYAFNNALLYVKGGAAVAADRYRGVNTVTGVVADRVDETRWGGVVGVGLEYGFTPNWSAAIDTTTCSWARRTLTQLGRFARRVLARRPHQAGCRRRHRARELSLGRPGRREVLIRRTDQFAKRPASRRPFCLRADIAPCPCGLQLTAD